FQSAEQWTSTGGTIEVPNVWMPAALADLPTDPRELKDLPWFSELEWKAEGDANAEGAAWLLGPAKGAIRRKYPVPGLRILYFGASLIPSGPNVECRVRLQCFDAKGRLVLDRDGTPDAKHSAGVYLKTQAHTRYVILSIEKLSDGGTVAVKDINFTDDDKDRIDHKPQVDLDTAMQPIWQGDTVHDESVLLLSKGGRLAIGHLLFPPTKILAVKDSSFQHRYSEGRDYIVEGSTIKAVKGSGIPTMRDSDFAAGEFPWTPLEGHHVFVTYTHSGRWTGPLPTHQGSVLPETLAKLHAKKPLTVVAYGDSITLGINVSGFRNVPPYLPTWPTLAMDRLESLFGDHQIKLYNTGLGGMTSEWGKENAKDIVASLDPDLVFIAFGMNDFWSLKSDEFEKNVEAIMQAIRARRPKCEFILISSMRFDPAYTKDPTYIGHFDGYAERLRKMARPGVALLDMTAITEALYKSKDQKELGADPMHPDDFLSRWYAQGIVATISPSK
ncbi:MAG TPA: SGNH/GDSL hydrolase family protein, partial [Fimbriimonas sp.]|nr:SGNH/GDSL hydrolase family protein [Fimbriimonas sp.]